MKKVYDIFKDNVTYVEYGRSGIVYTTDNLEELNELVKCGWKYNVNSKGFRVIPPEEAIVDITDYKKAYQYGNPIFNLAYYDFIKDKIENNLFENYINCIIEKNGFSYRDFNYLVSTGPVLDTEVRIAGSDFRIQKLKMDMVQEFIDSSEYRKYMKNAKVEIPCSKKYMLYIKEYNSLSKKEKDFYKDIKQKVSLIKKVEPYNNKIYEIENLDKLLKDINIDVILFLPFGCFKYLSLFVTTSNIDKTMFWEYHCENSKNSMFKLYDRNLKGKNVAIIDNIYSGKTLNKIKREIVKQGGNPIVIGISPKNKNNILITDYIIILNQLFNSKDIDINDDDIFREKYIEILRGD